MLNLTKARCFMVNFKRFYTTKNTLSLELINEINANFDKIAKDFQRFSQRFSQRFHTESN
jgi:hypothetical protein